MIENLFFLQVPTQAPSNLSVSIVTSSVVKLTWIPPTIEHRNGIIRHYTSELYQKNSGSDMFYHVREVVGQSSPLHIEDLHPFFDYQLRMAAHTVDIGPYSDLVSWRMPEDGKHFLKIYNVFWLVMRLHTPHVKMLYERLTHVYNILSPYSSFHSSFAHFHCWYHVFSIDSLVDASRKVRKKWSCPKLFDFVD